MKIGIIGAMDIEVSQICSKIENCSTDTVTGTDFHYGKINGKDVVVAKCGEGKVNSAIITQNMILKYNPDFIINTGVAGGLHPDMKVLDVAIAEDVCQHDFDISPLGYEKGFVPRVENVKINCDKTLNSIIRDSAKTVCNSQIFNGTIATGDIFVSSDEQRENIKKHFSPIATEMEGGSIGQVCLLNNKKFTVLRVMSDCADGNADMSFEEFAPKAAEISTAIILETIKNI